MRRKKTGKRWAALALAAVLAAGTAQPMGAEAAGGTYTGSGTFHIDQFGEYDINASVSVTDGVITGLEITGDNFGGTYVEVNKGKLASAVEGLQSRIIGLGDTDAQGLKGLDGVSGATYSSNGIKEAVASALGLSLEETAPGVPSQTPAAGTYDITVAVRSDVVDHSLVQTETAPAVLTVDESGQMTLSYTMVSGTDQEPMYILGFNGYYENNDTAATLTMEGAAYNTEQRGDYQVVTDVSFPLTGALSQYYYNNTCIYVPAMSNLNGEINGILFENGKFSVKTIVTMYWDTLTAREQTPETPDTTQESMDVTASVAQETSAPSYQVTVPSSLDMGALSRTEDNVQEYDITVSSQDKEGTVTVTAPEGGLLYAGSHSLAFSNDFGAQSFQAKETRDGGTDEAVLGGRITIAGADVAAAAPGNYTGTTTFTISYSSAGGGGTTEPEEPQPDPGENPGDGEEGEDLAEGTYTVDVALWHATNSTPSMGNAALVPQGVIVVDENGDMSLQLTFQSLDISGIEGYLYRLRKVDMDTVEYNQVGYPSSYEAADADVLSYFTGVYDAYNDPDSPSYDGNTEGKEYPKVISIPIQKDEDMNYVEIYVPVMEAIGAGQGTQLARLHIDWSTLAQGGGEPESPDPGGDEMDIRNLPDGVYAVTGRMLKVDKETLSMSDNAIDHTIKLTVKDGKYALTMNFRGLTIGTQLGYLSQLQYFATGYRLDQYGNPQGDLRAVTVDSYQQNEDGSRVSDQYGTDYPDEVTFELIPEALEDGYVPLQVFVPIMDAIASGTGTQPVFLALDWDTLQATTDDDPAFDDEGQTDDEETDSNGEGSGLTGGSGLGTSTLPGGSSLGGSSLGGSSLGGSSLGGSSLGGSSLSAARTGDETGTTLAGWAALLAVAAAAVVLALRQRRGSR